MVTSFSSKSEIALNLSTDRRFVTFMGYLAPVDTIDVSNSNTPFVVDPTNPVPSQYYRAVAKVDQRGRFGFTKTNAYSGNNGRAAVLNTAGNVIYTAGNAATAAIPSLPGSSSAPARKSSRQTSRSVRSPTPAFRRRPAASASPSSATRRTRSARTPTSAASRSSTTSSI
jgi:hypothetical protein